MGSEGSAREEGSAMTLEVNIKESLAARLLARIEQRRARVAVIGLG